MLEANLARYILPSDLKLLKITRIACGYLWDVEKIRQEFEVCPKCATPSKTLAGKRIALVRDQSLRQENMRLRIHKHRYFCKTCRRPFTESVSIVWPRNRTTGRFRKALARDCSNFKSLKQVARHNQVSQGFIYKIFYEQLRMKLREREQQPWPRVLGIDEHFFTRRKGFTEFATVFTDLSKKKLFEISHGKSKKQLLQQILHIPGRENVTVVVIDLSNGYRSLVKDLFPNAKIVADKFHCLKLLHPAIMREGKNIHGHRKELKTRRLLLCNRSKLDYFLRIDIDHYLREHEKLAELYRSKEKLFAIYRTKGRNKAERALEKWIEKIKNSENKDIAKFARTLKNWKQEILNYFQFRFTNAFTEASNNLAKLVQKQAYGYKSFENYRLRVLSAGLY